MFSTTGFSLLTFLILISGVIVHALKQFQTARTNQADITIKSYFVEHWPESVTATLGSLVLWIGLPEIASMFPEFAESVGLGSSVGIVSSFACGFIGNSVADLIGGRAKVIGG